MTNLKMCSKCVYSEELAVISFDDQGVCNYCNQINTLQNEYGTGAKKGIDAFDKILEQIKLDGKGKKYDCVVGVSGGTDSSYLLMKAVDWGLRPIAVHYDNTWNTDIATENIAKITKALEVNLHTYVVDSVEMDDLYRSFLKANVVEFDGPTDIAIPQVIRLAAAKYGVKYILEGHSFVEEGISPVSDNYTDGKYIQSVHKAFGTVPLKTFPNLTLIKFLKWALLYRQQYLRPFWYLDYDKEKARAELEDRLGWTYYGGHHLENRAAIFNTQVLRPQKFNQDYRILSLAAAVRKSKISRDDALKELSQKLVIEPGIEKYVRKRLNLSENEYTQLVYSNQSKTWRDYKTYKKTFERLEPLFRILVKGNFVTKSFYLKYCFPVEIS